MTRSRKQAYPGNDSRNFDGSCRSHSGCPWCLGNRMHQSKREAKPWREHEDTADTDALEADATAFAAALHRSSQ